MLKLRLITAAILVPVVVASILLLSHEHFALFFALFAIIAAWEWSRFLRLQHPLPRALYATVIMAAILACWNYVSGDPERVLMVLVAGLAWWACALLLVFMYPQYEGVRSNKALGAIIGLLVIVPCWLAIVEIRSQVDQGPYLVLFLVALIAVADSTAYFGGKKWGSNKLAPQVSPGKTWEGVISGLIGVALFSFIFSSSFEILGGDWKIIALFIMICVLTAITSVLGDLSESMFKRQVGLKDSGKILPGHGGIMDRIDSLTAAAPLFAVCLWLMIL